MTDGTEKKFDDALIAESGKENPMSEHEEKEGGALVPRKEESFSLVPQNLDQAMKYAELIAASDFAPKDFKGKPGNVMVACQFGEELGLKPLAALQNIAVINGRPCLWGDAALAVVKTHRDFVSIHEMDEFEIEQKGYARCTIKRRGQPDVTSTFTIEDAKKARLIGKQGPWSTNPTRMLKMRARGFATRDQFADALKGLSIREEVEDYIDVEPLPEIQTPRPIDPEPAAEPSQEPAGKKPEPVKEEPKGVPMQVIGKAKVGALCKLAESGNLTPIEESEILSQYGYQTASDVGVHDFDRVKNDYVQAANAKRAS